MSKLFRSEYAIAYDHLYRDKDYVAECELIDRLLKGYGSGIVQSILDLGCGTGNHTFPLVDRGYVVFGVDSSNDMLEYARQKAISYSLHGENVTFCEADIRTFQTDRSFDASFMMFAVLGYQLKNEDVLAALRTARNHIRLGGLFIFDVWYGPAVLRQQPGDRVKVIRTNNGQILRSASGELDHLHHLCKVSYRLWQVEGERLIAETNETHSIRYFFPLELALFLKCCGLALIRLGAFPEFDRDPDETTWNVCGLARAV